MMKRISVSILLMAAVTLGLDAQGRSQLSKTNSIFDYKLQTLLQTGKPSDKVRVIIQSRDLASLSGHLVKSDGKNIKHFLTFPGVAVELTLGHLAALGQDPAISAISFDELVRTSNTLTGTEPANS